MDATDSPERPRPALTTLLNRSDFLAAAKAPRKARDGFILQARERTENETAEGIRVGFTCSKKVGNAVARNRAKRRLREIARLELPEHGRDGWDYVLIGRRDATAALDFARLRADLVSAVTALHQRRRS